MLLKFFNKNTFANIIGVVFFCFLLWLPAFINPPNFTVVSHTLLFQTIALFFSHTSNGLIIFIAFLLVLGQAFYFNFIVIKYNLFGKNNYMVAFVYAVSMSMSPSLLNFHPFTLGGFLILLQVDLLLNSYKKTDARNELFYVGFLCGILLLLYSPFLLILLFVFFGIALFRTLNWREYVVCIMGFLLPLFFVFTYYYWQDMLGYFTISLLNFDFYDFIIKPINPLHWVFLSLFFCLIVFSIFRLINKGLTIKTMQVRKAFSLFFWLLLFGAAIGLFIDLPNFASFSIAFIPITIFLSNQYLNAKNMFWFELFFSLFYIVCFVKSAIYLSVF